MKTRKTTVHLFATLLFGICFTLSAQKPKEIEIVGKVLESVSNTPIEFATVIIGNNETNKPITGTTTIDDGSFSIQTKAKNFYIEISFIGFINQRFQEFQVKNGRIDLGNILLEANAESLAEVTLQAEKSQTEFKLDKRVFNVGKDISSTGASATEVLNNVPSVTVSIEGDISLRGSNGVQILINGKPSVMSNGNSNALGTITADMIEKIEVITNPSAKYDAEGSSGIINIVLKKEEKKGLNGSASINTGVPNNHSFGLSLNKRTEKFNLFSQLGAGLRTYPGEARGETFYKTNNSRLNSSGDSEKNEQFYNFILGTDYHINKMNVITLSGNYAYEIEDEDSETNFKFRDAAGDLLEDTKRVELTEATNPKWQYELQYKKSFEDHEDHALLFSAIGSFFGKDKTSVFTNSDNFADGEDEIQNVRTDFQEAEYNYQLDYTHIFSEKVLLETGAKYQINDISNDYEVANLIDGVNVIDPNFTNIFEFDQKVFGSYASLGYEATRFGIKAGLRAENTNVATFLATNGTENTQNYTNFFPSVHSSYKFTDEFSVQAGYSKRILRPRLWSLNPFTSFRNQFNLSTGNPELQPEFTDSYEINTLHKIGKATLNFSLFHTRTNDVIESIVTIDEEVSISRPENIGTKNSTGLELNGKIQVKKGITVSGDFNWLYFQREGSFEETNYDFSNDQWFTRIMGKFTLPKGMEMQWTVRYNSEVQQIQQLVADNFSMNFGFRKKLLKNRAVLNLNIRDLFASRRRLSTNDQEDFFISNYFRRGRFVSLGFSYSFGKGETMEFSGRRHR